jgi:hypothetical protein
MKRDLPATPDEWLEEIKLAIADAAGEPFGQLSLLSSLAHREPLWRNCASKSLFETAETG